MKIVIFGVSGQLGSALQNELSQFHEVLGFTHADADITDLDKTKKLVRMYKPEVVINAAAFTDVDGCELDPDRAFQVNALGPRNLAICCEEVEAKLVHISTDYVFDGRKLSPYREYDQPNPINIYGLSKLWGEIFLKEQSRYFFILRVAWLYGENGRNFLKTMLSLATVKSELQVVNDQWGTPTCVDDVARQIQVLIKTELFGTYHCTAQGACTWFEYALEIFKNLGYELSEGPGGVYKLRPLESNGKPLCIRPISSEEFPRPAKRPRFTVLDNYFLRLHGLDVMPDWKEALNKFFERLTAKGGIYESLGLSRR